MKDNHKIYFASDAHLGMHPAEKSVEREKILVRWLEEVRQDATEIYLVGDIFDYWFEYKKVVPRGFTRFLGKVAEITDQGIPVHYFTGNHDVWVFDYLPKEIGVEVHKGPITRTYNDLKFYIAHGDGLWRGEKGYHILKRIFTSKTLQWMYARFHPNFSTAFAHRWSKNSRYSKGISVGFLGEDKEALILFAREKLAEEYFDYFIFGHRHLPLEFNLAEGSKLFYLGDWIVNYTYAVFDGEKVELRSYK
ncbi:MAG: UDP-2,3-diacylglucosamine diphosphatase [Bacteroidales bacterium]|nr:UDP-2,3-diacylglucosamine diphosphatase [Bacteroidales bacterium]